MNGSVVFGILVIFVSSSIGTGPPTTHSKANNNYHRDFIDNGNSDSRKEVKLIHHGFEAYPSVTEKGHTFNQNVPSFDEFNSINRPVSGHSIPSEINRNCFPSCVNGVSAITETNIYSHKQVPINGRPFSGHGIPSGTAVTETISDQHISSSTESIHRTHPPIEHFPRRKTEKEIPETAVNTTITTNSTRNMTLSSVSINVYDQIVSQLIQSEANVNKITKNGETALHIAAAAGDGKWARLLIHNGANFTIKNNQGKSAPDLATEKGFTELTRVLQENVAQKACDVYSKVLLIGNRIFGGESVNSRAEFPWMAALGYLDRHLKISFNCAGILISDKFILTASQCVQEDNRPVIVKLGQTYLNDTENVTTAENHQIDEIIRHPDYSHSKRINDIALIKLVNPINFSEFIRPACLQTYLKDENPDVDLTVTGWGIVSPKYGNRSNILQKANLNTVPWSICNTTVFNYTQSIPFWIPFQNGINQSHYCAAHPLGLSDTCQGDSGGPLQIVHPNSNISTVVGVVSTGFSCGTSFPGIYTRVAYFIDWIESLVWPNGTIAKPLLNTEGQFY